VTTLAVGLLFGALLPGAQGAGPRQGADALRRDQSSLSARSHSALLSLYALDSRLARARAEVVRLRTRSETLRAEQARVAHEVAVAVRSLHTSQSLLGAYLRRLYQQERPDALAVMLGATSVEDAFARLDELQRSAHQSQRVVTERGRPEPS
jgi:hypothetical protein